MNVGELAMITGGHQNDLGQSVFLLKRIAPGDMVDVPKRYRLVYRGKGPAYLVHKKSGGLGAFGNRTHTIVPITRLISLRSSPAIREQFKREVMTNRSLYHYVFTKKPSEK